MNLIFVCTVSTTTTIYVCIKLLRTKYACFIITKKLGSGQLSSSDEQSLLKATAQRLGTPTFADKSGFSPVQIRPKFPCEDILGHAI